MNQTRISRSVKILSQEDGEGVGTGILIDSQHILTCAHVIKGAFSDSEPLTENTIFHYLPIGCAASEKQTAKVIYSPYPKLIDRAIQHVFPNFPRGFEEAGKVNFDYSKDLILLKIDSAIVPPIPSIYWKNYKQGAEVEGFGYHLPIGQEFKAVAKGPRLLKLHECHFSEKIAVTNERESPLSGASGTALLAVNNNSTGDVVGYGILAAAPSATSEGIDRAYFIPSEAINQFLSGYDNSLCSAYFSKRGIIPTDSFKSDTSRLDEELTLSLIDRQFIREVEEELVKNGLVCLTLQATEADWFTAIGIRVTRMAALPEHGGKQVESINVEWPDFHSNTESSDIFEKVLKDILSYLPSSGLAINRSSHDDALEFVKHFHNAINHSDRVAIGIKLSTTLLFPNEQQALRSLLEEMQVYNKQSNPNAQTEVLLYLVVDANESNKTTAGRFNLANLFRWQKKIELSLLMQEIHQEYQCCIEHSKPLELIYDSHIDPWIKTLSKLSQLDENRLSDLRNSAQKLAGEKEGMKHASFRNKLKKSLHNLAEHKN